MSKNYKLSELKYSLDSTYNLKIHLPNDIITINALEILELGKMILTEFQSRAKIPVSVINTVNKTLKNTIRKKRGRPKGSKNKIKN